jgi:hypothetical protein
MAKITIELEDGQTEVHEFDAFLLIGDDGSKDVTVTGESSVNFLRLIEAGDVIGRTIKARLKHVQLSAAK